MIKAHSTQTKVATEAENHKHSLGTKLGNLTSTLERNQNSECMYVSCLSHKGMGTVVA